MPGLVPLAPLSSWARGHAPPMGTPAISRLMEQSAVGLRHMTG